MPQHFCEVVERNSFYQLNQLRLSKIWLIQWRCRRGTLAISQVTNVPKKNNLGKAFFLKFGFQAP